MSRHSARGRAYDRLRHEWLYTADHGWLCHLCQRPVSPDVLPGTPQSPSVDHVIPTSVAPHLAMDTTNWRLAHLVCNQRRQAQPVAEVPTGATRQW